MHKNNSQMKFFNWEIAKQKTPSQKNLVDMLEALGLIIVSGLVLPLKILTFSFLK